MKKVSFVVALLFCAGAAVLLLLRSPSGSPEGTLPPISPSPDTPSSSPSHSTSVRPSLSPRSEQKLEPLAAIQTQACWDRCGSPCFGTQEVESTCPKPCTDDSECFEGELCASTEQMGPRDTTTPTCQPTHCQTDADCLADRSCLPFVRPSGQINLCMNTGGRSAGQPCTVGFGMVARCNPGLLCLGGVCSLASCSSDKDCGTAARCVLFAGGGHGCTPYCENDSDCPDDNICWSIGVGDGVTRCIHKVALGCLVDGCKDDSKDCVIDSDAQKSSYYATSCVSYCDKQEDCEDSEVCGTSLVDRENQRCYQKCTEGKNCQNGYLCAENIVMANETPTTACLRYSREEEMEYYSSFDDLDEG